MTSPLRKKLPTTVAETPASAPLAARVAPRLHAAFRTTGLLAVLALATSVKSDEPTRPDRAQATQRKANQVTRASDAGEALKASQWTAPRGLRDSADSLNWMRPQQLRMAEIHRARPSFLRSSVKSRPIRRVNQPLSDAAVRKATYDHIESSFDEITEPAAKPRANTVPKHADHLDVPRFAEKEELVVDLIVAQKDEEDDVSNIFDQELDRLLGDDDDASAELGPDDLPADLPDDLVGDDAEVDWPSDLPGDSPTEADPLGDSVQEAVPETDPNDVPIGAQPGETQLPSLGEAEGDPRDLPFPDNESPAPEVRRAPIFPPESAPAEPPLSDQDALMFNGRNCPLEDQRFQAAWEELRQRPISSISLDITPSINPMQDEVEVERVRERNMSRAPARVWRDRKGRVLADGSMLNYQDGVIQIDTEGGIVDVSWFDLSNQDLCFVSAWWELPTEFSAATNDYVPRNWTMTTFTWTASALCHKPLYFEEVQLERYGHSAGPVRQAALSGVHFFGNIFFLPYHMGLNPPTECQYVLGYYRPGSCAPWLLPAVPLSARGARWQLAAIIGGLTILP